MRWGKRGEKRQKKVKRNLQFNYNLLYKTYTHRKSIEVNLITHTQTKGEQRIKPHCQQLKALQRSCEGTGLLSPCGESRSNRASKRETVVYLD